MIESLKAYVTVIIVLLCMETILDGFVELTLRSIVCGRDYLFIREKLKVLSN